MAIQTTQSLMHTEGRAVVLRTKLAKGIGSVALRAQPLAWIWGYFDRLTISCDGRDGQQVGGDRCLLAANIELRRLESGNSRVNLMTGQTRYHGLAGLCGVFQCPRAGRRKGRDKVFDVAVIKHSVTAETFGCHLLHLVVLGIQKNSRVSHRVTAALPIGKTPGMAFATSILQGEHLRFREVDGFVSRSRPEMLHDAVGVFTQGVKVEREGTSVTVAAMKIAVE